MEPYYYKNNVWLYHANCIDFMKTVPGNVIDLTVTSPPYDNLRKYKDGAGDNWGEDVWKPVIKDLYRIIKSGGIVVWVVNDSTIKGNETGTSFKQALYFKEIGFNLHDTMIYHSGSRGAFGSKNAYWSGFEYMFVLSKGKPNTFNPIKDRVNVSHGRKISGTQRMKDGTTVKSHGNGKTIKEYGKRTNVWKLSGGKREKGHPAPFPEKLAKDHILSWSNEGDLVFDPFSGSGTTAKMCMEINRLFCGSEISKEYCDLSIERLESK